MLGLPRAVCQLNSRRVSGGKYGPIEHIVFESLELLLGICTATRRKSQKGATPTKHQQYNNHRIGELPINIFTDANTAESRKRSAWNGGWWPFDSGSTQPVEQLSLEGEGNSCATWFNWAKASHATKRYKT